MFQPFPSPLDFRFHVLPLTYALFAVNSLGVKSDVPNSPLVPASPTPFLTVELAPGAPGAAWKPAIRPPLKPGIQKQMHVNK